MISEQSDAESEAQRQAELIKTVQRWNNWEIYITLGVVLALILLALWKVYFS